MAEKSEGQKKFETLSYEKKNYFEVAPKEELPKEELKKMFAFAEGYKQYLDNGKTEREACDAAVAIAKEHGFTEYKFGDALHAGDKKYFVNRGKSVVVFRVGSKNLEEDGFRILGQRHVLFEDALLRRHQKISVDRHPPRPARRRHFEERKKDRDQSGRGRERPRLLH